MQKKLYIPLSALIFLGYILIIYFAYFLNVLPSELGAVRLRDHIANIASSLMSFVLPVSITMTVWGIVLARRAYRNAEKIRGLIVSTFFSGSWIIFVGVILILF